MNALCKQWHSDLDLLFSTHIWDWCIGRISTRWSRPTSIKGSECKPQSITSAQLSIAFVYCTTSASFIATSNRFDDSSMFLLLFWWFLYVFIFILHCRSQMSKTTLIHIYWNFIFVRWASKSLLYCSLRIYHYFSNFWFYLHRRLSRYVELCSIVLNWK